MEARDMHLLEAAKTNGAMASYDSPELQQLKAKWGNYPVGNGTINLLQGLSEERAGILAHLYENEMRFLLREDTLATTVGTFTKWALPMVRRLFVNQILPSIATVQPVSARNGVMLALGQYYDDAKGNKVPINGIANLPYQQNYNGMMTAGSEAIRDLGEFYANEYNPYHVTCTDTGIGQATQNSTLVNCTAISRQWGPIRAPGTSGQRTFSVIARYRTTEAVVGSRTATLASTGTNMLDQDSNIVGSCDVTTGAWTINALLSGGGAGVFASNTVIYWQYSVNMERVSTVTGGGIPKMSIGVVEYPIVAEPWALNTQWSLESEFSYDANYGRALEPELVNLMSNEVATEIDRNGINLMIAGAAHTATYTYSATYPGNMETIQSFQMMIDALSARVHGTAHRGWANFVVMTPSQWALLKQLGSNADWGARVGVTAPPSHGEIAATTGIYYAGSLPGSGQAVYINPYQDPTKVLVGYKGQSWLDAGFGYAPWVPIHVTNTLTDPRTLTSSKAIVSWGSFKMLRPESFGVLTIAGLPTVTTVIP